MNMKKCDRCGKLLRQADSLCELTRYDQPTEPIEKYDLCGECADKLENEFMKARSDALKETWGVHQ